MTQLSIFPVAPQYCRCTHAVLLPFLGWPDSSMIPIAWASAWSRATTRCTVSRRRSWSHLEIDKNSCSVRGGTSIASAIGSTLLRGRSLSWPLT